MKEKTIKKTKKFFKKAFAKTIIDDDRKLVLAKIVNAIILERAKFNKVRLNFICTHNSRRSQLGQVWAHYAIHYFNLKKIKTYSGGTEVTAMHANTVKTLQEVGFKFNIIEISHENPVYEISYKKMRKPIISFSKLYDDSKNKRPFIAITTCSSAHENCPFIADALERIHLPYIDPKNSDNTSITSLKYLETSKQIAAEMYFVFQEVKNLL